MAFADSFVLLSILFTVGQLLVPLAPATAPPSGPPPPDH